MKQLLYLSFIVLVATDAIGQHRGGFGGGGRGGTAHGNMARGVSPSGRVPSRIAGPFHQQFGPRFGGPLLFDDAYDLGYSYDYENSSTPSTFVEQPPQRVILRQAPPVAKSVIQNYSFGTPPAAQVPGTEPPALVIALNDGSRVRATAVWVQDGAVHYFDTDDRARQLPLPSVDRELTRKLNQERNLDLRLPSTR